MEECLIYFKMCWDGKKYVYIVRYGIWELYVDTLLEMDLIYIYIYFERHGIQRCMRGMYGYSVGNVFGKYMEVWDK